MSQTVGVFAPLQQCNAYQRPTCLTGTGQLERLSNPGMFVGGPSWDPRYASGYQGFKFYNPSEGGAYEGEKFYNPGFGGYEDNPCGEQHYVENPPWPGSVAPLPVRAGPWPGSTRPHPQGRPWPGNVRAPNPMDEGTMVVEKTVHIKHPRTHKSYKVSVVSVRSLAPGLGEVVVDEDYAMLWDIANNRPLISSVQACPMGYRLYGGRCFRKVRAANPCKTDADCPQEPCATQCVGVGDKKQCYPTDPLCGIDKISAAPTSGMPSRPRPRTIMVGPGAQPAPPPPGYPDPFNPPPPPPPTCAWGYDKWCQLCEDHGGNITVGGDCRLPDGHIVAKPSKPPAPPDLGRVAAAVPAPTPVPSSIARVAAIRQDNPRHPVYLNRLSLPWQYPWTYTHNPNTLNWGYVHPRHGYQTPWSGWGGWYPGYAGRSYYDDRVLCERVAEDQSCPVGTIVERDRDGNKVCCEQDGINPWYSATTYPYYIWWCPGCGHYPRQHHGRHRHHGAHGGPRGSDRGVVGRGGGMIRTGGGARGTGGGAIGSGGGMISTGGGVSNPADVEEISEVVEQFEENPAVMQPWNYGRQHNAPPTLPPPQPTPPPPPPPGPPPIPPTGEPVPIPTLSAGPSVQPGTATRPIAQPIPPQGPQQPQAPQQPAPLPRPMPRVAAPPAMQRPMQRPMATRGQATRAQAAMRGMVRR